ncbi:HAD-IA family hydrolase [Emcibacter sp. SYSU 3D8]|uniref:HAD-IA family hydrolase n=1 Tax=Emcibacter sp. SYSU 3D8 TaxID=3133969 RepID=UPI0031FE618F
MTDLRLIMFDCDGTLVDSQHVIFAAMNHAFDRHGMACPDLNAVRRVVGLGLVEAVAELVPQLDRKTHVDLAESYKDAFGHLRHDPLHTEPLFPGVREALETLSGAGYLLGVATGKSRRGLASTLKLHGMRDLFVTLQTADDAPSKPHPGMLDNALSATGARREDTVMIGDTVFDIHMARSAGVHPLGVSWGYHPAEELTDAGARHVLGDYAGLSPWLGTLWEKAA